MARLNGGGKSIKAVLAWILDEDVTDREMAEAIGVSPVVFSRRRKDADDFPTFEELDLLGVHFEISSRMLQIAFGLRGEDELVLLNDNERQMYVQQGGVLPGQRRRH